MRRITSTITLPISLSGGTSGGGGGGGIPAGVTFRDIDGNTGVTGSGTGSVGYYGANSFTFAASSASNGYPLGWDDPDFFPIGVWLMECINSTESAVWNDVGVNALFAISSATVFSTLRAASPPISLVAMGGEIALELATNGGYSTETVGFLTTDEPTTIAQAIDDFASGSTGATNAIQDHRFIWCNFQNVQIAFDSVGATSPMTAVMTRAIATPSGTGIWTTRHINIDGVDNYFFVPARSKCTFVGGISNGAGGAGNTLVVTSISAGDIGTNMSIAVSPGPPVLGSPPQIVSPAATSGTGTYTVNGSAQFVAPGTTFVGDIGGRKTCADVIHIGDNPANGAASVELTLDECANGAHYGDLADYIRRWTATNNAPMVNFIETSNAKYQVNYNVTPQELSWAMWASIIHGYRNIVYFNTRDGASAPPGADGALGSLGASYFQTPQTSVASLNGGNAYVTNFTGGTGGVSSTSLTVSAVANGTITPFQQILSGALAGKKIVSGPISGGTGTYTLDSAGTLANGSSISCAYSVYHMAKYTSLMIRAIARIINSPFALGYITTVSPQGYKFASQSGTGWVTVISQVKSGGIDCCAKYYSGLAYPDPGGRFGTIQPGFYILATTRESQFTGSNFGVTFTLNHSGATLATDILTGNTRSISAGVFTDTFANAWDFKCYRIS
jgi:hypothetical protein